MIKISKHKNKRILVICKINSHLSIVLPANINYNLFFFPKLFSYAFPTTQLTTQVEYKYLTAYQIDSKSLIKSI